MYVVHTQLLNIFHKAKVFSYDVHNCVCDLKCIYVSEKIVAPWSHQSSVISAKKLGYQLLVEPGNEFWNQVRVPGSCSCYKSLVLSTWTVPLLLFHAMLHIHLSTC